MPFDPISFALAKKAMRFPNRHADLVDVSTPHALADLEPAVASESEVDSKIATHAGVADAHHAKTSDAAEIITGRFGMVRMPDMALNKIMVGQGAGVDPVEKPYVQPAIGLTF